jgi:hypothetical protein
MAVRAQGAAPPWSIVMASVPDRPKSYADQMRLDTLLALQHPFADDGAAMVHDEMLFLVIHQTGELWFKLLLHETRLPRRQIARDQVVETAKVLTRMRRILEQLTHAWDVLSTMTPVDYMTFRDRLGSARRRDCNPPSTASSNSSWAPRTGACWPPCGTSRAR